MLEVSYYNDALFEIAHDTGVYHKIYTWKPSAYDDDSVPEGYYDAWYDLSRDLEDFLEDPFERRIFVTEHTSDGDNGNIVGDRFLIDTDLTVLSCDLIERLIAFLRAKASSYAILVRVCEDMKISKNSVECGRLIVTLKRIGVTNKLKMVFQEKLRGCLFQKDSTLYLDTGIP